MRKDIEFKCKICGEVYRSYNKKSKFCSRKCKYLYQKTLVGEKSTGWKGKGLSDHLCKHCGNIFEAVLSAKRVYCSVSCKSKDQDRTNIIQYDRSGDKNPNWKGNLMIKMCPECNEEFRAKYHKQKFCCKKCWRKYKSKELSNGKAAWMNTFIENPSKPQVDLYNIVKNIYDDAEINYFTYNFSIDVAVPSKNIAIEYDGSYWHKGKEVEDKKRQDILESKGWKFLRYVDYVPSESDLCEDIKVLLNG